MCLICIHFDRGALNLNEARRALGEMRPALAPEHALEVEAKLDEAEERGDEDPGKLHKAIEIAG